MNELLALRENRDLKISQLIENLERLKEREGDIEVTTTGTTTPEDGWNVFESTVETLMVHDGGNIGKRVRLYWQC